jgi:D-glycero-alpha-D-manno-heptose-7-phosphate kinase
MFHIQSPTRFDLAGGTLDLWPIWALLGKATTINVAIDIYTHCWLDPLATSEIKIESVDFKKKWTFKNIDEFLKSTDPDLLFFQAHIKHWQPTQGFSLKTQSDSPVGGGLGGSSSLSVSVYKAFMLWLGPEVDNPHEIVRQCSNIEAFILKTPTGTQDYYPPVLSGLNIIDFDFHGPQVQTLITHQEEIAKRFVVVYTGKSHHSGINNWQVLKKFIEGDKHTESALLKIAEVSKEMKQVCLKGQWEKIPQLFDREFEARQMLAESFMSEEISKLKEISVQLGAEGFKICGAGGGGCVVIWTTPEKNESVRQEIQKRGFRVLNTQPV